MNKFKNGDISIAIDFTVKKFSMKESINGFSLDQTYRKKINSSSVFHTLNEAIEHTIKQLKELIE